MMAAALVKEAILQYTIKDTYVHAAILDMSKETFRETNRYYLATSDC